ncbi:NUDIX domain-containing protein [Saccharomonospora piscinae]|uniref:NUDIX domain-containing protein n=1 Tax=Saccharomonospora piscinae TaxID=687388 RepID=UPI0004654D44|nr:NUDIX hydrolase [Saccharomonospora piscinae]
MLLGEGEGFVSCDCGRRHWGPHGAAGLLLTDPRRGVLLQHRAGWTHHGRTWALPGGAVLPGETPAEAATRETEEETAVPPSSVRLTSSRVEDHGTWCYTTVLGTARGAVKATVANEESAELRWVPPGEVERYPLHGDFAQAWPTLRAELDRALVLVVDAANVVGARPDGWWHDRAGAAVRLRDRLARLSVAGAAAHRLGLGAQGRWHWWPRVLLVTEGRARDVGSVPGAEVVAARGEGDDTIVDTVAGLRAERPRDHLVAVTADQELRRRVGAHDSGLLGPGELWRLLDSVAPSRP